MVNVLLNIVFVVRFGMDVTGVALATFIPKYLEAALIVLCLLREKGCCRLEFRRVRLHAAELRQIVLIGFQAGLQSMVFYISNAQIQTAINGYGKVIMAGNTAAASLDNFVYISMNAITQAAMAFTGQNVGAGCLENIRAIRRGSIAAITVIGLGVGGVKVLLRVEGSVVFYNLQVVPAVVGALSELPRVMAGHLRHDVGLLPKAVMRAGGFWGLQLSVGGINIGILQLQINYY